MPAQTPKDRREQLLAAMETLGKRGIDCARCVGTCCTQVSNSIQISPLETYDLLVQLHATGRLTDALAEQLAETVRHARLDVDLNLPRGQGFRRTYTCPFFSGSHHGCTIAPEAKPYGCLAFNPRTADQTEGGDCASDQGLLQLRRDQHGDRERERVGSQPWLASVPWEKKPIPVAVLELWKPFIEHADHLV